MVLVVDDDPVEGELFMRALRRSGFENPVQLLTDATQAKQYLRGDGPYANRSQFPFPGLVILDHRMPATSGWDVLEWMRRDPALRGLPTVVFSGSVNPADEAKASQLQAAYQVKPQNAQEYDAAVRRIAEFWLWGLDGSRSK